LVALRRYLAIAVLAAALCVGAVTTVQSMGDARREVHSVDTAPRVDGQLALFHDSRDQFVGFVTKIVPPHASVRILQPRKAPAPGSHPPPGPLGVCGNAVSSGVYWLFVYRLTPRVSVCDPHGSWTIYLGVPVPSGQRVWRFSATLGVAAP